MTTTPHIPGKFVWFEHVSNDPAKARAFYEPLFGWHVENMPMGGQPYSLLMNGAQGIGGLRTADAGVPNHWISYLSVTDVDDRYQAALAAGAKGTFAPMDFPGVGRGAGLVDPTGAAFCLWKSPDGDAPDGDVPVGGWVWNELWTPDAARALAFYEGVFGYTHDTMPMGDGKAYHILKSVGTQSRAGLAQSSMPEAPPMWLPYVHVSDCDATVAKAQKLGARQVVMAPHDIPGVGRIAILLDSVGAGVAMIKPLPRG